MAKRLFLLAAGAIALTACTSQDVVEDTVSSRNAIQFESVVNKQTRATDLDKSNLLNFNVFGFYTMPDDPSRAHAVFNHVPVSKSGGIWSYNDEFKRYWIPDATYYFYAYSCGSSDLKEQFGTFNVKMEEGNMDATQRTLEIDNYICDYSHQHDLLFASKTEYVAGATNEAVAFKFQHILTKLQARFTNTFSEEYDVVIKEVTVDDICNIGDYSFQTGWQDVNRQEGKQPFVYLLNASGDNTPDQTLNIISQNNKTGDPEKMTGKSETAYVIPKDYTSESKEKVYLTITMDLMYGSNAVIKDKKLTAILNPNWQPGYSYIYNIELNASTINLNQIEFDVDEVGDWGNGGDIPTPLN